MAKQTGKTNRRPGIGGTVAMIALGVIFMAISGSDPGESDPRLFVILCLTVGLALIAWGLLPWLRFRKEENRQLLEEERQREEAARLRAEQKAEKENRVRVCPNCGAPGRGLTCEYCGSVLP